MRRLPATFYIYTAACAGHVLVSCLNVLPWWGSFLSDMVAIGWAVMAIAAADRGQP